MLISIKLYAKVNINTNTNINKQANEQGNEEKREMAKKIEKVDNGRMSDILILKFIICHLCFTFCVAKGTL